MKLVDGLLVLRNQIKLYHWQTRSFARHKASDSMVSDLDGHIDKFIEAYQGTHPRVETKTPLHLRNLNDDQIVEFIRKMMNWLTTFEKSGIKQTDLLNIRDEILGTLRQGLYLFQEQ